MSSIATLLDTQSTTTCSYDQPLTSPPIMLTEKTEYDAFCFKYGDCKVPEKLNIKVRVNKGQLADLLVHIFLLPANCCKMTP